MDEFAAPSGSPTHIIFGCNFLLSTFFNSNLWDLGYLVKPTLPNAAESISEIKTQREREREEQKYYYY